jgi:serine/threonine-protein kinase HipA
VTAQPESNSDAFTLAADEVDVRHIEAADVYKAGRLAASITRTPQGNVFDYTPAYRANPGPAVATTLPITDEPVVTAAGAVPAYFAGLLPEGRRLTALRTAIKTSMDDDLSLLLAVGADPVGDVQIVPSGIQPHVPRPSITWQPTADITFGEILEDAGILNRRAIAGVQDKASAAMITVPAPWSGHDAIVKFSPPEYPHLVENEAWFLRLAKAAGFTTPRNHIITDRSGANALLLERFDRKGSYNNPERFSVEDATQVLDAYPADKYRFSSEQVTQALIARCQAPVVAAREAFRMFVFAWLTGNGDLHAKNISIINKSGEWRIAPAYDVPSTLPYGDDSMALTLAGRTRDPSRRAFLEFAASIELPQTAAQSAITSLLSATEPLIALFEEGTEPFTRPRNADVLAALRYRRRLLTD